MSDVETQGRPKPRPDWPNQSLVRADGSGPGINTPPEAPQHPGPVSEDDGGFDPGEHTVGEVQGYVDAHPDEADEVQAAEEAGKARVTLLDWFNTRGG